MTESVSFTYNIKDNVLEIIPESIKDNSVYQIRIAKLKSATNKYKSAENLSFNIATNVAPAYCSVSDVKFLVDTFDIPEEQILYFIREASKYADYIRNADSVSNADATFVMKEFVKTKTTLDCLLKAYIKRAAGTSTKGTLGVITYQDSENYGTSIGTLFDNLKKALKGWEDALKGYEREGRAKPRSAKKAYKEETPTTFSQIVNDFTRTVPSQV